MGLYNTEIFNNLGLCSFYAQQFDVVTACFENALRLALDDNAADVWYNISHVAIVRNTFHLLILIILITLKLYIL